MNGFLGILDTPVPALDLRELTHPVSDARVASVVLKIETLMDLIEVAKNKRH
jgi:hypothetical protein